MVNIYLYKGISEDESLNIAEDVIAENFPQLDQIVFARGEKGKPYVANADNVFFNISHSGDYLAVAVADCQVGVDIEKRKNANIGIAKRFFTEEEFDYISFDNDKFFEIWTLKESYVKYLGCGISGGLNTFSVVRDGEIKENIGECNLYKYTIEEYNIALCCEGKQKINIIEVEDE